jgi:site-specific recombinase XerD
MWLERWHNGESIRKSAKTRSWEQAQRLARAEEERYEQAVLGEKPKPTAVTVEEAANSFMDAKTGEGLDSDTLQKHRRMTTLFLGYCHRKNLLFIRDVTLPHLTAHRAEWEQNFKSKLSRRNNQGRLKEFFRYCRKSGWINNSPAEDLGKIRIRKNEQVRTDPFSPEEMQRTLSAIEPAFETDYTRRRMRALILAQRYAGLSIEDAIILPRAGIVEEKINYRVITDRKKTGAHIDNVIPSWVGRELLAAPNANPNYLLWSGEGDSSSSVKHFQKLFKKLFTVAGVPNGQRSASLRSEPDSTISLTPMEIATEMARLVLEMRDGSRNEKRRKQRLEMLAEQFLRITGQDGERNSLANPRHAGSEPSYTM